MIVSENHVMYLVVLSLLQSAGWMAMVQGQPLISVGIKKHLFYKDNDFRPGVVAHRDSKIHCEANGGHFASGYTKVLRTEIMEEVVNLRMRSNINIFIGADAEYSVHEEPDPSKKCDYSVRSLNCIYKWNQGIWANALGDGSGVGFYKGNDPTVKGAGVINRYDATVTFLSSSFSRYYVVLKNYLSDKLAFFLESFTSNRVYSRDAVVVVCEVQDGVITTITEAPTATTEAPTTTTEAPTTTTEAPTTITEAPTTTTEAPTATTEAPTTTTEAPTTTTEAPTATTNKSQSAGSEVSGAPENSDDQSGWSSGLTAVMVVLPILLLILAIVLCLYCCGCICRRKADGYRTTENSIATTHIDGEESVLSTMTENPNMDTAVGNRINPLLGEDGQERREIIRNSWIETPQLVDVVVQEDNAVPSDFDAAPGQLSRRRSSILSSRLDRWRLMRRTGVVVPIGEVIADDTIGE